jgi:hybrid cluster-associated redox disulfide protein
MNTEVNMAEIKKITKDMTIAEALTLKPAAAGLLMSKGMHCLGCVIANGETLEEAAQVHGFNADELVDEINKFEAKKQPS